MAAKQSQPNRRFDRFNQSWFFRWFVNNKVTAALINVLLVLIVIFVFTKVSSIFDPVGKVFNILLPPVLLAGVLYYLMEPPVSFMQRKWHIPRVVSTLLLFVVILALVIWGLVSVIPLIQSQITQFLTAFPGFVDVHGAKCRWGNTAEYWRGGGDNYQRGDDHRHGPLLAVLHAEGPQWVPRGYGAGGAPALAGSFASYFD